MPTLLLDINAVNNLMNMPDVINVVEEAFMMFSGIIISVLLR